MILSHNSRAGSTFHTAPSKESSHGALSSTAFMNASVTSTDRLNMRSRPASFLAPMKSSMSGWSQRRVAIIAPRPQGREVVTDAAALLHRQRRLAQMGKDPAHVVRDRSHHKAIEQSYQPAAAGTGDDPPRRQEFEIGHRRIKSLAPQRGVALGGGKCGRHAAPGILDRLVERLARRRPEPILHVPNLLRNRCDNGHALRYLRGTSSPQCTSAPTKIPVLHSFMPRRTIRW